MEDNIFSVVGVVVTMLLIFIVWGIILFLFPLVGKIVLFFLFVLFIFLCFFRYRKNRKNKSDVPEHFSKKTISGVFLGVEIYNGFKYVFILEKSGELSRFKVNNSNFSLLEKINKLKLKELYACWFYNNYYGERILISIDRIYIERIV